MQYLLRFSSSTFILSFQSYDPLPDRPSAVQAEVVCIVKYCFCRLIHLCLCRSDGLASQYSAERGPTLNFVGGRGKGLHPLCRQYFFNDAGIMVWSLHFCTTSGILRVYNGVALIELEIGTDKSLAKSFLKIAKNLSMLFMN